MTLYRLKHKPSPGSPVRYAVVNLEMFATVYLADRSFIYSSPTDLCVLFGQHAFLIDQETWDDLKTNLAPLARQSLNRLNPRNEEVVPDPTLPSEVDEDEAFPVHPRFSDRMVHIAEAARPTPMPQDALASSSGSTDTSTSTAHGVAMEDCRGIPSPPGPPGPHIWARVPDGPTTAGEPG